MQSDSPVAPDPGPPTIAEMEASDRPFVLADALGNVLRFNRPFAEVYGWSEAQLVGEPLGLILPDAFRMAHQFGFSRFQATERSTILAHPLRLKTLCADGRELVSEHFIVAEKGDAGWLFGATLTPLPDGTPADA
jgi:PAS domain S-box-containing protein